MKRTNKTTKVSLAGLILLLLFVSVLLPGLAERVDADVINLNFVSFATGVDAGPQDGIFDSFTILNLGSVNNNGYTSFRTAFEFSLVDLPSGSRINSANLSVVLSNFEGTRSIEVHGYAGDGNVQLGDFALNRLVDTTSADASGTQTYIFDVTSFVANLVRNGDTFAGFNIREEPANVSNFGVMFIAFCGLSIDYSMAPMVDVDIDVKPKSFPNSVNPGSKGVISVAILTTDTFDATTVDPTTVFFGITGTEATLVHAALEDFDLDGDTDLILHFNTQATGIQCGDTSATLIGETFNGQIIQGADSINTVGCK